MARAIPTRWRSPPDKEYPRSPTMLSSPSGSRAMTSFRHAISQERCRSAGETSRIIVMFSRSEKLNRSVSCSTTATFEISSSCRISLSGTSSICSFPLSRWYKPSSNLIKRRFPGARWSCYADDFSALHFERQRTDSRLAVIAEDRATDLNGAPFGGEISDCLQVADCLPRTDGIIRPRFDFRSIID